MMQDAPYNEMAPNESNEIDATATSISIFEYLIETDEPVGVSQVAGDLDISKSMAYNHLSTLQTAGYVTKRDRKYSPSLRSLMMGETIRRKLDIYEQGRRYVNNLAEATGESAELFVMEEQYAVPIAITNQSVDWSPPYQIGERTPLHATAAGKALLASLPPSRLDRVLDEGPLPALTDRTVTDRERLLTEIRDIREDGISFCREEQYAGIVGVGAPITADQSASTGALAIVGPIERLHGRYFEEDLVGQVVSTAKQIEVELTDS